MTTRLRASTAKLLLWMTALDAACGSISATRSSSGGTAPYSAKESGSKVVGLCRTVVTNGSSDVVKRSAALTAAAVRHASCSKHHTPAKELCKQEVDDAVADKTNELYCTIYDQAAADGPP